MRTLLCYANIWMANQSPLKIGAALALFCPFFFVGDVQDLSGAALASWAREANPSFKELLVSWLWSAWNQGNNYGIMASPGHMAM